MSGSAARTATALEARLDAEREQLALDEAERRFLVARLRELGAEIALLKGQLGELAIREERQEGPLIFWHDSPCSFGGVFVESDDPAHRWYLVSRPTAKRLGLRVITCAQCRAPALFLDPSYPYFESRNVCRRHWESANA